MKKVIIVFLLIILFQTCKAQNTWTYMYDWGGDKSYSKYYDLNTLEYKDGYIQVWTKDVYNYEYFFDTFENSNVPKKVSHSLSLDKFYCGKRFIVTLKDITVFIDGTTRETFPGRLSAEYNITESKHTVIPDSWAEQTYLFFCFK